MTSHTFRLRRCSIEGCERAAILDSDLCREDIAYLWRTGEPRGPRIPEWARRAEAGKLPAKEYAA